MARAWCCTPSAWSGDIYVWPQAKDGAVSLTPAQLSMLTDMAW